MCGLLNYSIISQKGGLNPYLHIYGYDDFVGRKKRAFQARQREREREHQLDANRNTYLQSSNSAASPVGHGYSV